MAKTKEKETTETGLPLDAETAAVLEDQVKKGKARKFILIYKGADIKKLIVFKKGPFGVQIQKAKKDGFRGEAACGVVTGSGVSLNFQLAGTKEVATAMSVDGVVDSEPTKTAKLKEFLAEHDLKRVPTYEIIRDVKQLAKAEDDQEGGSQTGGATPIKEAPVATGGTPADGVPAGDLEAKCKQLQAAVTPKIMEAVNAAPARKNEITSLLQSAVEQQKKGAWPEAFETLKKLVETVKEVSENVSARGVGHNRCEVVPVAERLERGTGKDNSKKEPGGGSLRKGTASRSEAGRRFEQACSQGARRG